MIWLLIITVISIWFLLGQRRSKEMQQIAKELPGTIPSFPIIGQAYIFFGSDEDRMKALQKIARDLHKQGGVTSAWHASKLYICVSDPEVGDILMKSCLAKDENSIRFLRILTGNGSSFARVNIWRPRRKTLAPIFSPRNLNSFVDIFAEQSAIMVRMLKPMVGAGDFSIWKYITKYNFDAISESTLGVKMNSQTREDNEFLEAFESATALISRRMVQPWLYSDFIYCLLPASWKLRKYMNYIDNFVDEVINRKRDSLDAEISTIAAGKKENVQSFLERIIESSGGDRSCSNLELQEETKVILIAGTDTSAVAVSFTLILLSRHPEIQEAVYKELYEVYGNSDRKITVEDFPKLKYLEAVIKESLRLYPPAPALVREVENDVTLPSGITLVKGIAILINVWGMHRNPRYWGDDVEQFRPERFLEGPLKHPAQFIPFSYGMRNCIGYQYAMMSMKTVLATVLRSYRVLPPVGMDPSHYKNPLRVKFDVMLRDVDKFVLRLEKRA